MARRDYPRSPSLSRGRAVRPSRVRVYIFAEGKITEPYYFEQFAAEYGNSLVEIDCEGGAGVPATLVTKALAKLKSIQKAENGFERNDQVWVVFDRDEHPEVEQSINRARDSGIKVGYSNPCFEVWLLLHYEDHDAPDGRHTVQRKLADCDNGYDRNGAKRPSYFELSSKYSDAVNRAKRMRQRRLDEGSRWSAPFTDIDLLTALIEQNGSGKR